ncbi:MAG: hypothetical protein ABWZ91_06270 [Nocardioides sp.]
MKKTISTIAAVALTATGAMYAGAAEAAPAAAGKKATSFAFAGSGFGTRVTGGQVPAGSGTSAFQALGCTNVAGKAKKNFVAEEDLGGTARAENVRTTIATVQRGNETASISRSHVARVVLAESGLGRLQITAIDAVSKAFHDGSFDTLTQTSIGGITFKPTGEAAQDVRIPTPGQPVSIPGLAKIAIGDSRERHNATQAVAGSNGIIIDVIPSGSQIRIAHTQARLERGVKTGLMRGQSMATRSTLAGGAVQVGKTPLSLMPCAGTAGKEQVKSIAHAPLAEGVELRGLTSRQFGVQTANKARGYELGRVNVAEFSQADLLVRNVIGRVNVVRTDSDLNRNIKGTDVGEIEFQGQEQEFDPGEKTIEIPGVAIITKNIVTRTQHGINVIALQVKLLDGTDVESIINLGEARMAIREAK